MSADLQQLTAFLAALAKTPLNEPIPPLNQAILTDSDKTIINLRSANENLKFWDYYDRFHALLVAGYTVKARSKILSGNPEDRKSAEKKAQKDIKNYSLDFKETFNFSDPRPRIQKQIQQIVSPSNPTDEDCLDYSIEIVKGWQPII